MFNVSNVTITRINNGVNYFDVNRQYSIRSNKDTNKVRSISSIKNNLKLNQTQLKEVLDLLKNTNISMKKIGEKYNISQQTVSQINLGRGYPQLNEYSYPVRKSKSHKYNN